MESASGDSDNEEDYTMSTQEHLAAWCRRENVTAEREAQMLALHDEDPEYWGGHSWRFILDEVLTREAHNG